MLFSRVGRRRINLDYLIMTEDVEEDGVPVVRITMDQGKEFSAPRDEAKRLIDQVDTLAENPFPPAQTTVISRRPASAGGPLREESA